MDFNEVVELVENGSKKLHAPISQIAWNSDVITIKSALYSGDISYYNVKSMDELVKLINKDGITKETFKNPFYFVFELNRINQSTINIINEINESVPIAIEIDNSDLDEVEYSETIGKLLLIKHNNCHLLSCRDNINIRNIDALKSIMDINRLRRGNFVINSLDKKSIQAFKKNKDYLINLSKTSNCSLTIYLNDLESINNFNVIIDDLDSFVKVKYRVQISIDNSQSLLGILNYIKRLNKKSKHYTIDVDINDYESLMLLDPLASNYNGRVNVTLNDNLFDRKYKNNARAVIFKNHKFKSNSSFTYNYQDMEFKNIDEIILFEKNIDVLKSHIPKNASKLDIITYLSIFIINYFHYDHALNDEDDKLIEKGLYADHKDRTMPEFLSMGRGVCRHYADFTEYFLESYGIKCDRINVFDDNGDNGHAINIVELDGHYYFLDNTWLASNIQDGKEASIEESENFLQSNNTFGHFKYAKALRKYRCEQYDRDKITDSILRVMKWNDDYHIHFDDIKDMFMSYLLNKEPSTKMRINAAIPGR